LNLKLKAMWIARDKFHEDLNLFYKKPLRRSLGKDEKPCYFAPCADVIPYYRAVALPEELCPEVTWENSPIEVESITIKLKDNVVSEKF